MDNRKHMVYQKSFGAACHLWKIQRLADGAAVRSVGYQITERAGSGGKEFYRISKS